MALFAVIRTEEIVQVGDKTRIDASECFASGENVTKVEIQPYAGAAWVDVTSAPEKVLDWAYVLTGAADPETVVPSVRVTGDQAAQPVVLAGQIKVISAAKDKLFSSDAQLKQHEPDLHRYLSPGRSSFLNVHRAAQGLILEWLDRNGYSDINEKPYTKDAIVDINEVATWSKYVALRLIFEAVTTAADDIFSEKAKRYKGAEVEARQRAIVRLDQDGNGTVDLQENIDPAYATVARR